MCLQCACVRTARVCCLYVRYAVVCCLYERYAVFVFVRICCICVCAYCMCVMGCVCVSTCGMDDWLNATRIRHGWYGSEWLVVYCVCKDGDTCVKRV